MTVPGGQLRGSGAANFAARGLNAALGVWLLFSPRLLDYADAGLASTNHLIVGPLIASFAVIAAAQASREVRWLNLLLGAWLVLAAFVLPHPPVALFNAIAVGMSVALLSLVAGSRPDRQGGGWRAVIHPFEPEQGEPQ
jgi:hypothetical protein